MVVAEGLNDKPGASLDDTVFDFGHIRVWHPVSNSQRRVSRFSPSFYVGLEATRAKPRVLPNPAAEWHWAWFAQRL
jgi:hypothetical protein